MIKGDMCLKIIENGNRRDIIIKQGEVFLLPAKTQHSPQRYKNTIGITIHIDIILYFTINKILIFRISY